MTAAALIALALAAAPGDPGPDVPPVPGARGEPPGRAPPAEVAAPAGPLELRIAFLPLAAYGSNLGLQLGAALLFYRVPPQGGPRRDWAAIGASWAERGPRAVEAKGERFALLGTQLRAQWQAKYSSDELAPYWGEGARLPRGTEPGIGSPPPPNRYRAVGPWVSLHVRAPLSVPRVSGFGRLRFRQLDVSSPGALLAAERPSGAGGGVVTLLHGGVLRDTRDEEISPSRGSLADVSIFGAPAPVLSDHAMWGVNAGLRGYRPLARGVVVAARAMYELKLGDVPFHERTQVEGIDYGEGLGGPDTIRGVARARLAGEEKMLLNAELRATLITQRFFGRALELGVSGGGDAARARQRGHRPIFALGAFTGLRAIWDRALVVRLEVGQAGHGGLAWYLAFDETF